MRRIFLLTFAAAFIASVISAVVAAQTVRQLPNPSRQGYTVYELVYADAKACFYVFGDTRGGVSALAPIRLPANEDCPELVAR